MPDKAADAPGMPPARGAAATLRPAVYVDRVDTLGAIAVVRSLGRAGYAVHAATEHRHSLGLLSRYVARPALHPPMDSPAFLDWFRYYIAAHGIVAVVPSEQLALRLTEDSDEFFHLIPFATSPSRLRRAFGKYDLFAASLEQGLVEHLPALRLIDFDRQEERMRGTLRFPAFIKADAVHARQSGLSGEVVRVRNPAELEAALGRLAARFARVLVQGYVPGIGVGASFLLWDGVPCAEFLHRRLHEVPYTGGISSWREEFRHAAIRADALARIQALGWERGPVMVEYRLDERTGDFWLMEANARFWGSLHLPYYAGVDFPAILLRRFLLARGMAVPEPVGAAPLPRRRVSCRHLPAEAQHCWGKLKSPELPLRAKLAAVGRFFALMADPRVRSDLGSFPGDRHLLLVALYRFGRSMLRGLLRRVRRRPQRLVTDE